MITCKICNREFRHQDALNAHGRAHSLKPRSGLDIQKIVLQNNQKRVNNIAQYNLNPIRCKQCNCIINYDENEKIFCNSSCAAKYNNTHKTTGTRRSKLEAWLEIQLLSLYPQLDIHFNKKDAINSELDIFIPSLKLAFEINGIYHYEPIHGAKLLENIQNNDNRKFQACLERNIEFCIIDSSTMTYFKPEKGEKYLHIIVDIINNKLALAAGSAPANLSVRN